MRYFLFGTAFFIETFVIFSVMAQPVQLASVVSDSLREASKPGGIIDLAGCEVIEVAPPREHRGDLDSQLTYLTRLGAFNWRKGEKAYLVKINTVSQASLLDVKLPSLTIVEGDPVSMAGAVMRNEVVQVESRRLKIRLVDRDLGASSIVRQSPDAPTMLRIPAGRVSDDLNWIASRSKGAVWLFRQSSCKGKNTGSLSWLQK